MRRWHMVRRTRNRMMHILHGNAEPGARNAAANLMHEGSNGCSGNVRADRSRSRGQRGMERNGNAAPQEFAAPIAQAATMVMRQEVIAGDAAEMLRGEQARRHCSGPPGIRAHGGGGNPTSTAPQGILLEPPILQMEGAPGWRRVDPEAYAQTLLGKGTPIEGQAVRL